MTGGRPGSLGLNLLIQNSGKTINLGSKATVTVNAGVSVVPLIHKIWIFFYQDP